MPIVSSLEVLQLAYGHIKSNKGISFLFFIALDTAFWSCEMTLILLFTLAVTGPEAFNSSRLTIGFFLV
jgi:hypothetical protein